MNIIDINTLPELPASHENSSDPGVYKKILFTLKDFGKPSIIQMINWARLPIRKSFSGHYHEDMDEVFIILSGKATVQIGKEIKEVGKQHAVLIPALKAHKMTNVGNEDVYYVVVGVSRQQNGKTINVEK
jgi:mannose-6-phosphate isomerase-like protein (cupin superfamily)